MERQRTILFFCELDEGTGGGGILARLVCGDSTTSLPYGIRDSRVDFLTEMDDVGNVDNVLGNAGKVDFEAKSLASDEEGIKLERTSPDPPTLGHVHVMPVSIRHQLSPAPPSNL